MSCAARCSYGLHNLPLYDVDDEFVDYFYNAMAKARVMNAEAAWYAEIDYQCYSSVTQLQHRI